MIGPWVDPQSTIRIVPPGAGASTEELEAHANYLNSLQQQATLNGGFARHTDASVPWPLGRGTPVNINTGAETPCLNSFRNLDEIKELAGCDLLTIAPKFLEELKKEKGVLIRKLDPSTQINNSIDYKFEEKDFRLSMLEDQMASEKLSEGITGFSKAIEELEELLQKRYSEIKKHKLISAN